MLDLPDDLIKNLVFIADKADALRAAVSAGPDGAACAPQTGLAAAELALTAFSAADELEGLGNTETVLERGELARLFREAALLCLDVQEDGGGKLASLVRMIGERVSSAAELAGLPAREDRPADSAALPDSATADPEAKAMQLPAAREDETETLKREIRALRELLASLVFARDHLVGVTLRDIEAAYMQELGGLEAEAYRAECEVRILKARLEMMQARLNREEAVRPEEIEQEIRTQYDEYRRIYEEILRRIFEAGAYRERREKQKTARAKTEEKTGDRGGDGGEKPPEQSGPEPADAPAEETEEQECKRLYRKIVKAMHPDLHPDQDEATKDLFKKAILAYKELDLQTLREIGAMLDGELPDDAEDLKEELLREKARLLSLIRGIRAEIDGIRSRYPYTKKALLDDPAGLEAEKERLRARIDSAKRAAEIYRARIAEIGKRYERSDDTGE